MATPESTPSLVLTDGPVLSSSLRLHLDTALHENPFGDADVGTRCSVEGLKEISSASYTAVLSVAERPGHHSQSLITEICRILKPGGSLLLQEPVAARAPHTAEEQAAGKTKISGLSSKSSLERALLLAGFSSWTPLTPVGAVGLHSAWAGITPASVGSLQGPLLQPLLMKATKPDWSSGASFSLKRKTSQAVQSGNASAAAAPSMPAAASWKVNADDDELVDEDSLLTAEDLKVPSVPERTAPGCDPTKPMRKACKNCTCGRAEMEENAAAGGVASTAKLTLDQVENPQSACGSCGLGDAFRCAGCPYRGLPPFKLGDKITLGSAALSADV